MPVRTAADPESVAAEPVSAAIAVTGAELIGSAVAPAAVTTRVAAATEAAARCRGVRIIALLYEKNSYSHTNKQMLCCTENRGGPVGTFGTALRPPIRAANSSECAVSPHYKASM
jgi:hypothetical protein